jgi:hypothetical protein
MNKKTLLTIPLIALILALSSFSVYTVQAQNSVTNSPNRPTESPEEEETETTPSPTAKPEEKNAVEKEVQELREKVESKVSELQNQNKTTYAGYIVDIKDNTMQLRAEEGDLTVDIDPELTQFFQVQNNTTDELKKDDFKKNDYILVSGPEIGKTITANAIYKDTHYIVRSGKIIEVNSDTFYVRVQTQEKVTYILDIEQSTTQQILDIKTMNLESAGFSKLKEGDNIHFYAKSSFEEDQTRFAAVKTIIIPQEYFIKE